MWYVYILYSKKIDRFYTGVTDNIPWRIYRHNHGWGRYTRRGIPWKLEYTESFATKTQALQREKYIKRRKSRKYLETLLNRKN